MTPQSREKYNEYMRRYYHAHKAIHLERCRASRKKNPSKYRAIARASFRRWYYKHRTHAIARVTTWQKENRMSHLAYRREWERQWRKKYPDRVKAAALKHCFGITLDYFKSLGASQGWKCAICRKDKRLVVDHDHKTGKVRGLLCRMCNLWIEWHQKYAAKADTYLS